MVVLGPGSRSDNLEADLAEVEEKAKKDAARNKWALATLQVAERIEEEDEARRRGEREEGEEGEEVEEGEPVAYEARDICPLNLEGGPSLDALAPGDCWDIGPFEARLHAVQHAVDGGRGERTALRSLFDSDARPGPRDGGDR